MWRIFLWLAAFWVATAPAEPDVVLADLARFPPAAEVDYWIAFNESYQKYCRDTASAEPWAYRRAEWAAAAIEAERMQVVWYNLHCAHTYSDPDDETGGPALLSQLRSLRGEIGAAAYYAGRMPEPVPWHRWRWADR